MRFLIPVVLFVSIAIYIGCGSSSDERKLKQTASVLYEENQHLKKQIEILQKENNDLRKERGITSARLYSAQETKHTWQMFSVIALFGIIIGLSVGMGLGSRARKHAENPPQPPLKEIEDQSETIA